MLDCFFHQGCDDARQVGDRDCRSGFTRDLPSGVNQLVFPALLYQQDAGLKTPCKPAFLSGIRGHRGRLEAVYQPKTAGIKGECATRPRVSPPQCQRLTAARCPGQMAEVLALLARNRSRTFGSQRIAHPPAAGRASAPNAEPIAGKPVMDYPVAEIGGGDFPRFGLIHDEGEGAGGAPCLTVQGVAGLDQMIEAPRFIRHRVAGLALAAPACSVSRIQVAEANRPASTTIRHEPAARSCCSSYCRRWYCHC